MTKRLTAKHKIDRRLGLNLWGRAKSPFNKKNYGPGEHGQQRVKPSDYSIQLKAKQKLKGYYGNITERQFHRIYKEAARRRGDTSQNMIELLERRLDTFVYRAKWCATVFGARQLVNHGHVRVNGKRINIPSYTLKDGDVMSLSDKMKENTNVVIATQSGERDVPNYVETDYQVMKGSFLRSPQLNDVPYPVQMDPQLVIEFYSR
ncbi:MAG: 30S ribosomal protein S4 [Alphaproteobacteria bacterium]